MKYLYVGCLFIFLLSACYQTPDVVPIFNPVEDPRGLDCILATDENGATIGTFPDCDPLGQWIQTNLNSEELKILDFPDTVTAQLATSLLKVRRAFAYPNPIGVNESLTIGFNGIDQHLVKIKLAVVNEGTQTVQQTTILSDRTDTIQLNIASNIYNPGSYYRVYFQVLGDNDEIFIEGYGNIFICRSATVENVEECFQ
ncbi:hypothetical protein [Flavilitoribacter nigricans]|uniref:Uncharacterized protein n=1 Tax=Flavilitoribacter nigricans (strain ATCC 23147 / DSM 23189 / NBRC 102662 / NCIMB 1420 / SS-2) TaxID=1122177 RepID=A0A2D0NKB0_FLAN2|nr:hypothetical protein [Flavilitoribacter nigricans]PHN08649.1 hypothetical protein CRP01_01690 [Flavilitoribacter nigricans DSM 23189 = NBRC 102662]